MPKVSVIIPVYNVEKYLRECLDSVINQTLKDIEIICVDDGSTDSCPAILDEYAYKDNRIKVIHQENGGLGHARNVGLKYITADYVFFLDSDDFIDVTTLEKMYNKSTSLNLDICVCGGKNYDTQTGEYRVMDYSINKKYLPDKDVFSSVEVKDSIFHLFVGWVWDKLYKSSLIIDNNLRFPRYKNTEDTSFTYMALILSDRISTIEEPLHVYRYSVSTSMSVNRESEPDAFIKAMSLLKSDLEKRNLYEIFKTGYISYFVTFSKWHLETISRNYQEPLYKKIRKFICDNISKEDNPVFLDGKIAHLYKAYIKSSNYKSFISRLDNKNTFLQNIFSIKNSEGKVHKILTILGVKLKIKNKAKFINIKNVKLGSAKYFTKNKDIEANKTNINIVFCIDDNYVQQCAVTLTSILANSKSKNFFNFYILTKGLKEENKEKLNSLAPKRDFNITYIDVNKYDISQFPLNRGWISDATYYRLFLADVLPSSVKKCIYLDCDMIVEDDISILWNYDISNYYIGAVEDELSSLNTERLGLPAKNNYFNAGMIIFNLDRIREISLIDASVDYYRRNKEKITMQDQDILNGVLNGKCKFLPLRWNVNTPAYVKWWPNHYYTDHEELEAALNPGILHFTGIYKPWKTSSMHPLRKEYQKYLNLTGFKKDIEKYKLNELRAKFLCKKFDWRREELFLLGLKIYRRPLPAPKDSQEQEDELKKVN